ncbi:hypothetical protein HDV06_005007 [Boothiomyces sp. JEL0866]|nr:hypothetical protein HDV06_005007 [Boothiomyces sp. JEL0866]
MKGLQIGDLIGKGASGTVYRAIDTSSGLTVAIKKIRKLTTVELQETMQEILLLTKLSHENIVQLYGYEIIKDELLIIMEYCELGSLRDTINKFGSLPEKLISGYIKQVLVGLEYLHHQGVIHRDIKSANLLTTKQGIVKLADFGIASKLGMTKRALFEGSPYWMAPEVIELNGSSSASDIWSVGCTALELFTGSPPFYDLEPIAALFRIASSDKIPYPKAISPYFEDFLDNCFQKDPNLRIQASRLLNHPWVSSNTLVQPKKQLHDHISWRNVDLELFKEMSDDNDYSMDFADEDVTLEVKMPNSQQNECIESELEDTFQGVISSIPTQKSLYETLSVVRSSNYNNSNVLDCLRLVNQANLKNDNDLDIQITCLLELEKHINQVVIHSDEYVQLFRHCFRKLPHCVLQLALGSLIEILVNAEIPKKSLIISEVRNTLEKQSGMSKDDLLTIITTSRVPQILLQILNSEYPKLTVEVNQVQTEILLLFQLLSSSKREVVKYLATLPILKELFIAVQTQPPSTVLPTLRLIKNICRLAENLDIFNQDNKIEILTILLWKNSEKRDGQLQILNSLFYILRHNRKRQEKSLQAGLLDCLRSIIQNNYPEKQYAIPILCDLICNVDTKFLWSANVFELLLPLLEDQCWRNTVFETIVLWYFRDTQRVEDYLSNSLVFLKFFSVKYYNSNAERQCISLLLQLVSASKRISTKLLEEGILNYLMVGDNFALVEVSVDILKILSLLLKPMYSKYWISNQPLIGIVLKYAEKVQTHYDSIVIKQLLIIIRQNIKSLFTNICSS